MLPGARRRWPLAWPVTPGTAQRGQAVCFPLWAVLGGLGVVLGLWRGPRAATPGRLGLGARRPADLRRAAGPICARIRTNLL